MKNATATYTALDDKHRRLTRTALADVKAGRTHEHADIEAWAAKLTPLKRKARR